MKKSGASSGLSTGAHSVTLQKEPKKRAPKAQPTPIKHTFYVVAVESPRRFNGIIGPLDLYKIHVLVEGSGQPLQEICPAEPVAWYRSHLESQGIAFTEAKSLSDTCHVLTVNSAETQLDSYAQYNSLSAEERADPAVTAWKTYYIPCHAGTKKEALGFWVCAAQEKLGPLSCAELFETVL
jgi:hypothetical protein